MSQTELQGRSLRAVAKSRGVLIGTCVAAYHLSDPQYAELAGSQFSLLEPENEMKFQEVHPEPNRYDFGPADEEVSFAKKNHMAVRGHTLVWYQQIARWAIDGHYTPTQLQTILQDHIHTVVGRYKGVVKWWDVVNEALDDSGNLRSFLWSDKPGIGMGARDKYIEAAFRWAHEADPSAKLFYNDYNIETVNAKSNALYAMLKDLKARGVPISGLGFQCHLDFQFANQGAIDSFKENIERFKKLGLEIQFTELDVRMRQGSEATFERQAWLYGQIVKLGLDEGVKLIQIWGITDKYSWFQATRNGEGWPLLWDDQYRPKPALESVKEALARKD